MSENRAHEVSGVHSSFLMTNSMHSRNLGTNFELKCLSAIKAAQFTRDGILGDCVSLLRVFVMPYFIAHSNILN